MKDRSTDSILVALGGKARVVPLWPKATAEDMMERNRPLKGSHLLYGIGEWFFSPFLVTDREFRFVVKNYGGFQIHARHHR